MTKTTVGLKLFYPIRPQFWANIGIPYSKSAIMRTRKSLECKRKALRIKFQKTGTIATVKTLPKSLYSSLNLEPDIWTRIFGPGQKIIDDLRLI